MVLYMVLTLLKGFWFESAAMEKHSVVEFYTELSAVPSEGKPKDP